MITDLDQEFLDEIVKTSRSPVQLLEFVLPDEIFYLSDKNVGTLEGLLHEYHPWVESWGELIDNTSVSNVFDGESLEIRSGTITLLASPDSRTFIKKLFQAGIENTEVRLYQWFSGLIIAPQLIDIFVCQDPISLAENSMLLTIDLVSPLMATNPYLWAPDIGVESQPVVIGKAIGLPLKNLQTSVVTKLAQDLPYDFTGNCFIENGVGFTASGVVSIDAEAIAYSAITASIITITARGQNGTTARPHYNGGTVTEYGAIFDYAICSGPVAAVDNLLANGEEYINPVTFLLSSNPVIARFTGRPPWLRIEIGSDGDPVVPDPVTVTEYAGAYRNDLENYSRSPANPANINTEANFATMAIDSTIGGGSGGVSRYSTAVFLNNLGSNNYQKIGGNINTSGTGLLWSKCGTFGNVIDDAQGSVDVQYGWDDSALGDLVSTKVVIAFGGGNDVIASSSALSIIFVDASGGETILETWAVAGLNYVFGDGYIPPWNSKTFEYNVSVANFADLQLCRVRILLKNIEALNSDGYSIVEDRTTIRIQSIIWKINNFVHADEIGPPSQYLVAHFNKDLSPLGDLLNVTVKIKSSTTIVDAVGELYFLKRSWAAPGDDVVLNHFSGITDNIAVNEYVFNLGAITWAQLSNLRIGIKQEVISPTTEGSVRRMTTIFHYVKWLIEYQPAEIPTPDELRVVYSENLTCDVTSIMGENPTPPQVVQHLIENNSNSGAYIDTVNFAAEHALYDTETYYLNGVLDTNTRLHDGLRTVLGEGMCRLIFNQGFIKILSYFDVDDATIDHTVSLDEVQIRSRRIDNQPTEQIKNDVTILYNRNYVENFYNGEIHLQDDNSITKFQLKDFRKELKLISSPDVATLFATRMLSIFSTPTIIISFNMFMSAYILEKGDRISIPSFIDSRFRLVGSILSISRVFGQGKTSKINTFNIQVYNPQSLANLELSDTVVIDDNLTMGI